MRNEVLRLSDVTYAEQGGVQLENFNLNVFEGEIMGVLPLSGHGMTALCTLLRGNPPLDAGYVYYREELVNSWRAPHSHDNRIAVIEGRSSLVGGLTVADNIFVLRPGFKTWLIRPGLLFEQLQPVLDRLDAGIRADAYADSLSTFQRVVVELVKAAVAGCKLVILREISAAISDTEMARLRDILRHYAQTGMSFLYIGLHYEEMTQLCARVAVYARGRVVKVLRPEDGNLPYDEQYVRRVREQMGKPEAAVASPALSVRGVSGGAVRGLSFGAAAGECVVLQDLQSGALRDFLQMVTGALGVEAGEILVDGKPYAPSRDVAVIDERPDISMIFGELSYLDNLCMTMDHRLPEIWKSARAQAGIRQEWARRVGEDVFDKNPAQLTRRQKYDLVYQRILLQRPKVVFCVQPFRGADVDMRMHIWSLLRDVMDSGAALVILAVNLADTLSLATRLVRMEHGAATVYERSEFDRLPFPAPWLDLYRKP